MPRLITPATFLAALLAGDSDEDDARDGHATAPATAAPPSRSHLFSTLVSIGTLVPLTPIS